MSGGNEESNSADFCSPDQLEIVRMTQCEKTCYTKHEICSLHLASLKNVEQSSEETLQRYEIRCQSYSLSIPSSYLLTNLGSKYLMTVFVSSIGKSWINILELKLIYLLSQGRHYLDVVDCFARVPACTGRGRVRYHS